MKKLLFVYNPRAGKEMLKPRLSDVLDIFVKAGYEVTVHPTQAYRDAYYQIKEYEVGKYDLIACSGGDGTIDEVATGMMKRREMGKDVVPVGYIPAGTTNDFAKSLHIPRKPLAAADNAVKGVPFPCDIGKFNDSVFVYIAAFGIFTDVSYETDQAVKNVLGHMAYILEGAKRIFNIPSYKIKVEHDGEVIEDEFIFGMVTNSRSVGGFSNMVGKNIVFDDGLFEVTLIKTPKNPIALQEIIAALLIEQVDTKHMYTFKTKKITFDSVEEIPWTLDGEFGGEQDPINCLIHKTYYVEIENVQKAMEIMVPENHVLELSEQKNKIERD